LATSARTAQFKKALRFWAAARKTRRKGCIKKEMSYSARQVREGGEVCLGILMEEEVVSVVMKRREGTGVDVAESK